MYLKYISSKNVVLIRSKISFRVSSTSRNKKLWRISINLHNRRFNRIDLLSRITKKKTFFCLISAVMKINWYSTTIFFSNGTRCMLRCVESPFTLRYSFTIPEIGLQDRITPHSAVLMQASLNCDRENY